jgi:hypothetical protein
MTTRYYPVLAGKLNSTPSTDEEKVQRDLWEKFGYLFYRMWMDDLYPEGATLEDLVSEASLYIADAEEFGYLISGPFSYPTTNRGVIQAAVNAMMAVGLVKAV